MNDVIRPPAIDRSLQIAAHVIRERGSTSGRLGNRRDLIAGIEQQRPPSTGRAAVIGEIPRTVEKILRLVSFRQRPSSIGVLCE